MTGWTTALRHPEGAWGWGASVAALAAVVLPQLAVQGIAPEARSPGDAAATAGLVLNAAAMISGIFMYLHHRLTRSDSTAWLAAGLIFVGGFGLTITGLDSVSAGRAAIAPLVVADVVVVLALLGMVRVSERIPLAADPAAVGLVLAVAASGLALVLAGTTSGIRLSQVATAVLAVPIVGTAAMVAVEVERLATLPSWARARLALAITAMFLGNACLMVAGRGQLPLHLASIVLTTAAAALFLGTSLAILRLAIHDDRLAITALQDELASTTSHAQADRERLHEVRGTIAGIASASRLIHRTDLMPGASRAMLEEMLERESARLQRLMQGTTLDAPRSVPLDDILRPLVVARRAQGQHVDAVPTDLVAWAREDDLAEVVNILLNNSAQHAPGACVEVFARESEGHIEIVVADSGPGLPADCGGTLFLLGERGAQSRGEGLGLPVTRRLMARSGGYVRHDASWKRGAAFVVGIRNVAPLCEGRRHDAVRSLAQ